MIRRFLTRVLMLILIAACGCNWLQTQQLQSQVTELQSRLARSQPASLNQAPSVQTLLSLSELQIQWKQIQNRAEAIRSASKKVFSGKKVQSHEAPI